VSPHPSTRSVALGSLLFPLVGVFVVAGFGYRDLASAWPLWIVLASLGAGVGAASQVGVRVARVVAVAPFVLAVDPLFGSPPPASAGTLVVDALVSTVAFGFLAVAEYGLRHPESVRRELDPRTRRFVAGGAVAVPALYVVARAVLGLGWITAGPLFVVAASTWTLGGLACCGAVAGGFLVRDVYAPAAVVFGSLVVAAVAAADSGAAMVTELTLLGTGWFVPLGVAVVAGLAERRFRAGLG
jgi:hypothetical protein